MVATKMALKNKPEASPLQDLGFLKTLVHDREIRCRENRGEKELPGRQKNNVGAVLLGSLEYEVSRITRSTSGPSKNNQYGGAEPLKKLGK